MMPILAKHNRLIFVIETPLPDQLVIMKKCGTGISVLNSLH